MMNVIFIAPPASGKGTISNYLVENYGYIHLSTGDILREKTKEDSSIGKSISALINEGKFVSDDVMFGLIRNKLETIKDKPFILDGMPRNINQAKYLEIMLNELGVDNYIVININLNKDLLEKRATGRRLCGNCGASYNIYFEGFKPTKENACDKCNSLLIQRKDDTTETFKKRYETYLDVTEPVINFYEEKGLIKEVDANKSNKEIIESVKNILKGDRND